MSDLLSNCCAADFDAFGYEKENGVWQERCLKCGKLCDPIMLGEDDIANIRRCLKWNATPIDDKPEKIKMPDELEDNFLFHAQTTDGKPVRFSRQFVDWMLQVTDWINNHE